MTGYIVDCETNGLKHREVVELAYCNIDIIQRQVHLGTPVVMRFNPTTPWEPAAVAIHHIAPATVVTFRPSAEASLPPCEYVIGHNCDFDMGALHNDTAKRICTLAISRRLWPDFQSHSLGALYLELFGMSEEIVANLMHAHSGLGDINILIPVVQHIVTVAKVQSLEAMYEMSEICRVPVTMPFGKHKGTAIADIPLGYRAWLLELSDLDPYLRKALTQ